MTDNTPQPSGLFGVYLQAGDLYRSLQLDIYGELMDSVYLYDDWHRPISSAQWDTIITRTDWVCGHWDQPDEGIWEIRGGPKKFL